MVIRMEYMIEVRNVTKKFKTDTVLNGVSIMFERGKIHGIIGRNGSGKTVLFKCICGFLPYEDGHILVRGKEVGKEIEIPRDLGIIIEAPSFLPNYSGYKNLKMLADINGRIDRGRIQDVIQIVGLDPKSKKHVSKYSLGMRQRLGIAQAMMEHPDILILDEPMNGLDNRGVEEIRKLLLQLKKDGVTILLASHNAEDIKQLCDTVHEMDAGNMVPPLITGKIGTKCN